MHVNEAEFLAGFSNIIVPANAPMIDVNFFWAIHLIVTGVLGKAANTTNILETFNTRADFLPSSCSSPPCNHLS